MHVERLAALERDTDARLLLDHARQHDGVLNLFGDTGNFDAAVEASLTRTWPAPPNAVPAEIAERAVRDVIADRMVGILSQVDLAKRASRLQAPAEIARAGVERAQEKVLLVINRFREPTDAWRVSEGVIRMPFNSSYFGWLRWIERQQVSRLLQQQRRRERHVRWVPIGSDEHQISEEILADLPDTDPAAVTVARTAHSDLERFWGRVEAMLRNPGEALDALLSPDLLADAGRSEIDLTLGVAARLATVLGAALVHANHVNQAAGWWSDLDLHLLDAFAAEAPGLDDRGRAQYRANVGHSLASAMQQRATSDDERVLGVGVRAWSALHLKNFVQRGPVADGKPVPRVEARAEGWSSELAWLEGLLRSAGFAAGPAASVLAHTATWLTQDGLPQAGSRWSKFERGLLETVDAQGSSTTVADQAALDRWARTFPAVVVIPPLATRNLVESGVLRTRAPKHRGSELVLLTFIDVVLNRMPAWAGGPPQEAPG